MNKRELYKKNTYIYKDKWDTRKFNKLSARQLLNIIQTLLREAETDNVPTPEGSVLWLRHP